MGEDGAGAKAKPIYYCGARRRNCSQCKRRYVAKVEAKLDACPECGFARACRCRVRREGQYCPSHERRHFGLQHGNWKHGRTSKAYRSLRDYLGGDMGETADLLQRSEDLDEEIHLFRVLLATYLKERRDAEEGITAGFIEDVERLANTLRKLLESQHRIRNNRAVTDAHLALMSGIFTQGILEFVPMERMLEFRQWWARQTGATLGPGSPQHLLETREATGYWRERTVESKARQR